MAASPATPHRIKIVIIVAHSLRVALQSHIGWAFVKGRELPPPSCVHLSILTHPRTGREAALLREEARRAIRRTRRHHCRPRFRRVVKLYSLTRRFIRRQQGFVSG